MKNINKTLQELIEEKYGKEFSISKKEMFNFLKDLIDNGFDKEILYYSLINFYRDDIIDYYDLKDQLDLLNLKLPPEFSFHSEKAKQLIRELAPKVKDSEELANYLYTYYYNNRIDFNLFQVSCLLLNYKMSEEFINMDDDERRNKLWLWDKNHKPICLSDAEAGLFKTMNTFKYIPIDELLMPSVRYTYPMGFVFDYMDQNNIDDKVLVKAGLDRRKKYVMNTQTHLSKTDCFRLIFALNMSTSIAKQFLTLAGYCFSPVIPEDLFFLDYLNGKYKKVDTLEELQELADNEGIEIEKKYKFPYKYWK